MPIKTYTNQFKDDAVRLYESTEGATYKGIAADLGVSRGTLQLWVQRARLERGEPTARASTHSSAPVRPGTESAEDELTRLRSENRVLRAETRKLAEERDILRKATKYFAAETNW